MLKMKKNWLMALGLSALVVGLAATPAGAACSTSLQVPVGHSQDDYFACADKGPVGFYAYSLSTTAPDLGANSNGQPGVCTAADPTQLTGCCTPCTNPNAGGLNDNQVDVQYDWGALNTGSGGCPSNAGNVQGNEPVAFQIVDSNGKSVIVTVGYDIGFAGYLVDQAFQLNATQDGIINAACTLDNAPIITSSSAGPSPSVSNVCTHLNPTHVLSSCDANALGSIDFGAGPGCGSNGQAPPSTGLGRLYAKTQPCDSPRDLRLAQGWTLLGVQGADACNPIPVAPTGQCTFVGATGVVNGVETAAIAGALLIGQAAAVDKVKIDKAVFSQGKLIVGFSTTNETATVGFNVYAGSTKLNSGLVKAQGTGSNAYTFEAGRSDVKANRTVTVEAVKSDGSVEKSAPVSLK